MNGKVIDTLLGLFDKRVSINLPAQFFRFTTDLLQCLINWYRANRNRRVAQNPFACFMDIFAR